MIDNDLYYYTRHRELAEYLKKAGIPLHRIYGEEGELFEFPRTEATFEACRKFWFPIIDNV